MKILTAQQMGDVDRLTTEQFGMPSLLLMENAGRSVVDELQKALPRIRSSRILVLCGHGNNGGDGFVVARQLAMRGARAEVLLLADPGRLKGDALINWNIVKASGPAVRIVPEPADAVALLRRGRRFDVVVDALFGTGLSHPVGPGFSEVIEWVNSESGAFVAAIDIPSGIMADSSEVSGPAVKAALTVTFSALKLSLVVPPAADWAGKVVVAPIGSPDVLVNAPEHRLSLTDVGTLASALPPRPRSSHKGTFGHVFVVAGSRGKSGAAIMAGLAALRSGAGLVTLFVPESLQRDLIGRVPELMIEPLPETDEGAFSTAALEPLLSALAQADAVVIGPGITTAAQAREFTSGLVRRAGVPLIVDADGLNAFAGQPEQLVNTPGEAIVITPHPGEMGRLAGMSIQEVQADRLGIARSFARAHRCITVLKGFQTITALPSGAAYINSTGNPGLATGGSGDILAGIVGRFVGGWRRGEHAADQERLGESVASAVYIHGLAGDLAVEEKGVESLIATDLLPFLPGAFKRACRA
jgi:ADP-dependent NAD(P)H-hydrate dehydratase / NAD(P)H-hydrate epimerase